MKPVESLKIVKVPVAQLHVHPKNARQGDVGAIVQSLQTHGQYKAITVQKSTMNVIAGNHTLMAASALGWETIDATVIDVDDDQALKILLVDNRTSDLASYNDAELLKLLLEIGPEGLDGTGYDGDDIDSLVALTTELPTPETKTDPDDIPDRVPSKTVKGDVWLLGPHRLVCGDSTSPTDIAKLMNGKLADLVWTDPPYNVAVKGKAGTIMNDDMDRVAFRNFLREVYASLAQATKPGGVAYIAHGEGERAAFTDEFEQAGFKLSQNLIWVKQTATLSRQDFNWRHEPILYGWREGAGHFYCNDFTQTTVIDDDHEIDKMKREDLVELVKELQSYMNSTVIKHDRPTKSDLHPTMKPVALVSKMIEWSSRPAEIVLDLFGGSGSTLIAAHLTNRTAYMMELDPHFCDVICTRWQAQTGVKPIAESTGQEHDFGGE